MRALALTLGAVFAVAAAAPLRPLSDSVFARYVEGDALRARFDDRSVSFDGFLGQGRIFVYAFGAQTIDNTYTRLSRIARVVEDRGADGALLVTASDVIPTLSFWLAADLSSGKATLASPHRWPGHVGAIGVGEVEVVAAERGGRSTELTLTTKALEVVLMRAGAGAWWLQANDGGESDADGDADGRVTVRLVDLEPRVPGDPSPPATLERGDLVLLVDVHTMRASLLVAKEAR
jgi:hypothetical protein